MLPTVAQVLEMDAVRRWEPRVVAGEESLGGWCGGCMRSSCRTAARLLRGGSWC
jgi:hypothetical protein